MAIAFDLKLGGKGKTMPIGELLLNFISEESDRRALRKAVRITRAFMTSVLAKLFVATDLASGTEADCDEAIDSWLRATVQRSTPD